MKFRDLEESRAWALSSMDALGAFVRQDPDFRGNKKFEEKSLFYQRQCVEDGKYRVVFLGTFNVGKSTAINAFLGAGYLPMDVEECTSKLAFIQRGEAMSLSMGLSEAISGHELEALRSALQDVPSSFETAEDGHRVHIRYEGHQPDWMRRTLEPLVTVMADETYPHLAPLREKIEDLHISLPSEVLEEDIVFVDTPGVHSVSETRQEITYGIIERSHLVISFVDSSFAGNIHDLNFIKRIIKWRGRRVFFVLNKADKLETSEIDVRGARGPAKSLIEAFARHDIPEDSEIFFLSGYRALRALELDQGYTTLEAVQDDNKVSIPTSIMDRIGGSDDPARDLSAFLMGQSRLPHLRERLMDYLLNENKAGAVLETAVRFVGERAEEYVAGLENELKLAKDPTKFEDLRRNREALLRRLDEIRASSALVLERFRIRSRGGETKDGHYAGYAERFRVEITETAIQDQIISPLLAWLRTNNNLKTARRQKFKTLSAQTEHQVDEFVSAATARIMAIVEATEQEARQDISDKLGAIRELRVQMTQPAGLEGFTLETSMARSYMVFGTGGALVGVAAGAAVGTTVVPVIGTAIGAGIGALFGAVGGFLTRLAWSEDRWLKKLEPVIRQNVMNMLIEGGKDHQGNPAEPIIKTVSEYLDQRAESFHGAVEAEVNNAINSVQAECDDLLAREDEIRRQAEAIIARLEPKVVMLHGIRDRAALVVESLFRPETVRV
ncbi:MAG: dynamin family protein [Candidatus Hydrogenedentes bacterium]|nr:dynamin family protein [Candidatus Hydrogenedentota bacterium]